MSAVDVTLRVKNAAFRRGMEQANSSVQTLKRAAGRFVPLSGFGITIAAIASIRKAAVEYDRIAKLAKQLRTDVESVQRLDFVSQQAGADIETVNKALQRAIRNLAELQESGDEDALSELGYSVSQLRDLKPDELILALAAGYEKAADKGRAVSQMSTVFGRSLSELLPLLDMGSEEIARLANSIDVLSASETAKIEKMNDSFNRMGRILQTTVGGALAWVIDKVERLAAQIATLLIFLQNLPRGFQAAADAYDLAEAKRKAYFAEQERAEEARLAALNDQGDTLMRISELEEQRTAAIANSVEQQKKLTALAKEMVGLQEKLDQAEKAREEKGMGPESLLNRRLDELRKVEAEIEKKDRGFSTGLGINNADAARQRDVLELRLRRSELTDSVTELRDQIAQSLKEGMEAAAEMEREAVRERLEMWGQMLEEQIDELHRGAEGMKPVADSLRQIGVNLAGVDYGPDRDYQRDQWDELRAANKKLTDVRRAIDRLELTVPTGDFG